MSVVRYQTSREQVLQYVVEHPLCTTREITEGLGLSPGTVSHYLATLTAKGLVGHQMNWLRLNEPKRWKAA